MGDNADDAQEWPAGTTMNLGFSSIYFGYIPSNASNCGLRWTGVSGLSGATIDSATLSFYANGDHSAAFTGDWYGEDGAAPGTFTTTVSNITDRTKTTATCEGDNTDFGVWTNDTWETFTGDGVNTIKQIIQELADSYDPSAIVLMHFQASGTESHIADSHDGDATKAAKLDIISTPGGALAITGAGIASVEAFGSATVALAVQTITGSGIASAEAFGAATLTTTVTITGTGIASAEAFGSASVAAIITGAGIASAEAFGGATITTTLTFTADGIASLEAFGAASVAGSEQAITGSGIASLEAFGAATVAVVTMSDFGNWRKQINTSDYPTGAEFFFEAVIATSDAGFTAYAWLYNITDGAVVAGSQIQSTDTSDERVRSAALSLPAANKEYRAKRGGFGGATYKCYSADVLVPNA
ncbi:hypothetical protein LCGC14_0444950 [marine sediment metagenome]|uniref:Uncharacterized protein n=1 Tax=marine sediment metagenome TaxID=412755 RepID=A0A0F9VTE2_9ZZZZ